MGRLAPSQFQGPVFDPEVGVSYVFFMFVGWGSPLGFLVSCFQTMYVGGLTVSDCPLLLMSM